MSFEVSFRKLTPQLRLSELQNLTALARTTFSNTFVHYTEVDLNAYLNSSLTSEKLQEELEDPTNHFYLVLMNSEVAGYLKFLSPSTRYLDRVTTSYRKAVLLERFYFLPDYFGTGLASIALEFVTAFARTQAGADLLYLSVWEKNYRAQSFYQKSGFRTLGSFDFPVGEEIDLEFLYGKKL